MQLIVTRPQHQSLSWLETLSQQGVNAMALPLIEIGAALSAAPVTQAWHDIDGYRVVMFVSANAAQRFFAARPSSAEWPARTRAASTGPGTTAALIASGLSAGQVVQPDPLAARFDSEALWSILSNEEWQGARVLVVRGDDGRDWLGERWRERGAAVQFVSAYRRQLPQWSENEHRLCDQAIATPHQVIWLFSSSEAVANLQMLRPAANWGASMALVTHQRIAQAARSVGFAQVQIVAPLAREIADALKQITQQRSVQSARL